MVATSSEARRLALGVQCADSRIVGQPDFFKELKEAVAAIRRCRRPTFIQPMATRLDLTAAGVDVYCRSAGSSSPTSQTSPPPVALPPSQISSGTSRCLLHSSTILSIASFLPSAFPSSSYGRHKIVCSQPSQYSTLTTSSSLGLRGSCSSSISRPSRNIGYLSSQNGRVPDRDGLVRTDVREGIWEKGFPGFPEFSPSASMISGASSARVLVEVGIRLSLWQL